MDRETFINRHGANAYVDLVFPREKHFFPKLARLEAADTIDERISELTSNIGMENKGLEEAEKEFKKGFHQPGLWEILLKDHKLLPVNHEDPSSPGFESFIQDIKDAHRKANDPMLQGGIIIEISR